MPQQILHPNEDHTTILLREGQTVEFVGLDGITALKVVADRFSAISHNQPALRVQAQPGWKHWGGGLETAYAPAPQRTPNDLPYKVGRVAPVPGIAGLPLRQFATEQEASKFIGTLEGHEDGRYYLDGPKE